MNRWFVGLPTLLTRSSLSPPVSALARLWYFGLSWVATHLYYHRITVRDRQRLVHSGAALYVALHRNGAVDGFIYNVICRRATFMISAQLRRSMLGRLMFSGIEVVRDKDQGDRSANRQAIEECLGLLGAGGALLILPEGTSDLGPRHLPFKRGAARILNMALMRGIRPKVIPLGIHYERAWAFRSNVEVVVGEPVDFALPANLEEAERIGILHQRIAAALDRVGVNVGSADEQDRVERLAYAATLGTGRSYFACLKAFEAAVAPRLLQQLKEIDRRAAQMGLLRHQGVPLVPIRRGWLYCLALALLAPMALLALALNLPPLLAAHFAATRLADARNTIALWRLLVGVPALALWSSGLLLGALATDHAAWFAVYALASVFGLLATYRAKKLAISVFNLMRGRALRPDLLRLHASLLRALHNHAD